MVEETIRLSEQETIRLPEQETIRLSEQETTRLAGEEMILLLVGGMTVLAREETIMLVSEGTGRMQGTMNGMRAKDSIMPEGPGAFRELISSKRREGRKWIILI